MLYTGTKGAISAATVDGKSMQEQSFSFNTVEAGTYKLVILKPGKYVPKIVEVTVTGSSLEVGQQKLWLYGDVNYDGTVDGSDVLQINRYIANKTSVFTKGDTQEQSDRINAANVTAINGADSTIDGSDVLQLNRYIANKTSVLNAAK